MHNRERLIQEDYIDTDEGPWKVLVICQCLNQSTWMVAEKVVAELFRRYPTPESIYMAEDSDAIYRILRPLGLGARRTKIIAHMSYDYAMAYNEFGHVVRNYPVHQFRGCGDYAVDAWYLFVLEEPRDPKDIHLRRYAERAGLLRVT